MMNSIKAFVSGCPILSGIDVNINYLGENAVNGAIENVSAESVIKNYTDGGTIRQCVFAVSLRQDYGRDAAANNAAIGLLEQISDWLEEQDRIGMLPILDGNKSPVSLEVLKTCSPEEKTADTAKYQLQCRLVYYQD